MRRLFTFGCSYTMYDWPTWADLLGLDYDLHLNWGQKGLGNRAISERLAECFVRFGGFTKDDTVIVQWSGHTRHDWHNPDWYNDPRIFNWKTLGSPFNHFNQEIYDEKWIRWFFSEFSYFMHTLNHIFLSIKFLESTPCTWYMTSMGDIKRLGTDIAPSTNEAYTDRKHAWEEFPILSVYENHIWNNDKWIDPIEPHATGTRDFFWNFDDSDDMHPSTTQHYLWLKECLRPKLGFTNINLDQEKLVNSLKDAKINCNIKDVWNKILHRKMFDCPEKLSWPKQVIGF